MQTFHLTSKSELLVLVRAPEGKEGPKQVSIISDQVPFPSTHAFPCWTAQARCTSIAHSISLLCTEYTLPHLPAMNQAAKDPETTFRTAVLTQQPICSSCAQA